MFCVQQISLDQCLAKKREGDPDFHCFWSQPILPYGDASFQALHTFLMMRNDECVLRHYSRLAFTLPQLTLSEGV